MSSKLKAFGLAALAVFAMAAFGAINANAERSGHFTSSSEETTIVGTESGEHNLDFSIDGIDESEIGCTTADYHGVVLGKTFDEVTVVPDWRECYTTSDLPEPPEFDIHENECHLKFTSIAAPEANDATAHVHGCDPTKPYIDITHENCTIRIPEQTVKGVTYTTIELAAKHAITMDVKVPGITTHFESFGCQLLFGTKRTGNMEGSVTVEGFDIPTSNRVDVTAT